MRALIALCMVALLLFAAPVRAQSGEPPQARSIDSACPEQKVTDDGFTDVTGSVHEAAVDCIVWWGVARGKTANTYAPGAVVTRGAMATFIANLIVASAGTLPRGSDRFS